MHSHYGIVSEMWNPNYRYWQWWILRTVLRHFLVVHWIGIHLPVQVRSLPWEDSMWLRAAKPVSHDHGSLCAAAAEAQALRACSPEQESPQWEALALWECPLLTATRESPGTGAKTQCSLKLKKKCWKGKKARRVRMANKHMKRGPSMSHYANTNHNHEITAS